MDMVYYKTTDEVEIIRKNCLLVCKVLSHVAKRLKPGLRGSELDREAEEIIRDHGAEPGFKGYRGFPATLCISLNESVVHGIPNDEELKEGDIVSVDCGVKHNGYYGDAAYSFAIGEIDEDVTHLLRTTREALYKGIDQAVEGNRLGDIGHAIQQHAEKENSFGVVRELVGHGIGQQLHEEPEVPNYGRRGSGPVLKDGLVIAIEPMVNMGGKDVSQLKDGWTIVSRDRKPSAHFEHTVVVRKEAADVLSDHSMIEEEVKNNPYLKDISLKK